jgi:clan AA aspartic protease (TIGR02281 family)
MSLASALVFASPGFGQIYRWTDDRGTVHFTDNLEAVPPAQRGLVGTMDDRLPSPEPPRIVPLEANEAGYVVQARINGAATVRLILDTGATATVLSPAVAARLGLEVRREPAVLVRTAGGTVRAGTAEVDEIEVGGRRAGPLQVIVHDALPGADGLLGMNFLGLFHVELRAGERALLLTPR